MATIVRFPAYYAIQDIRHAPEKIPEALVGLLDPVNWRQIFDIKIDTQFSGWCGIGEQIFLSYKIL